MANEVRATTFENTKLSTVKLDWKEVYYTNCPLVSASNVDQELGWTREEYKKIGVKYAFMRSTRQNDWYPHYIHNLDNLIRFGGLFPPVQVHADIRRTRLLGVTHVPHEGGVMMVRAKDDIYRMQELKGKKIGLSKSMNQVKNDWWRIQEQQGIKLMLRMNGMTMDDVEIVEFPYADDWYNNPAMLDPMENPSELWLKRDHKHAAAAILDKQTFYRDVEDTYEGIRLVDMVPNLSPQNLACVEIGKNFMLSHGYIKNDFDVHEWAAPQFLEQAAKELLEQQWKKVTGDKLPDATELLADAKRMG